MSAFQFELQNTNPTTLARAGVWKTPHGEVQTPAFMPVGTLGTVKGLLPDQLRATGAQMVLANTYHLALRPGEEVVKELGGLHSFMNWEGPILTDSGGFQVFSLAKLSQINEEGVSFRSHIDGSLLHLSPERATAIQEALGADCMMCFDECPPHDVDDERMQNAVDRTTRWAKRCRDAQTRNDQALFGILQGGTSPAMRERSAKGLLPLDFPAYAIGGLSVGEKPAEMYDTLNFTVPMLPTDRPRYLMGVGTPVDLVEAVARGIDLFDCVMPTRNGRNASAFTSEGRIKMRNLIHQKDQSPLDPQCDCVTCTQFSRGYLRHLFMAKEMLGPILLSLHNIAFYQTLMRNMRTAIIENRMEQFRNEQLTAWGYGCEETSV